MKVAIASDGIMVSGHFGFCEGFTMYETENNQIANKSLVANPGHKPGFLPVFLKEQKADVIIAGGMGETAQNLFNEQGIEVVVGAQGLLDDVIKQYMSGALKSTGSVCTEHTHEDHCND
ncbi:NifB/NifX family molybdenum-iron cluster-binding protein [[Clostridium] fimetarium]|uniref:Predicted Fe-Mo cluster-binding protein, NifX family n=1 Tax=[Clostridium] fimetarium TaxID=99656 RepID=A0A1I0RU21_9FIRM|nr:NifB/NifX family molybdenum-iron cluster-binding protein [[Clostridium] fimetarium]SEW44717.1 Predicted Fe-Mo cluster-binding protein, NifX family [[Clostridium] fimetarium]